MDGVAAALAVLGERHPPFEIEVRGLGAFPEPRRAKVLWAGVGTGTENLKALALDVEEALDPLGFEREQRTFAPHFTLGRARRSISVDLDGLTVPQARFVAESFKLVESVIGADGIIYRPVASFSLARLGGLQRG